jgi:hypothetical protein
LNPAVARVSERLHYPLVIILICMRWYVAYRAPVAHLSEIAMRWLAHQPASMLRAARQSVVTTTRDHHYLAVLEQVFDRHPVYLFSGEHSRKGYKDPIGHWENTLKITH